jgi:hypothetical protein
VVYEMTHSGRTRPAALPCRFVEKGYFRRCSTTTKGQTDVKFGKDDENGSFDMADALF